MDIGGLSPDGGGGWADLGFGGIAGNPSVDVGIGVAGHGAGWSDAFAGGQESADKANAEKSWFADFLGINYTPSTTNKGQVDVGIDRGVLGGLLSIGSLIPGIGPVFSAMGLANTAFAMATDDDGMMTIGTLGNDGDIDFGFNTDFDNNVDFSGLKGEVNGALDGLADLGNIDPGRAPSGPAPGIDAGGGGFALDFASNSQSAPAAQTAPAAAASTTPSNPFEDDDLFGIFRPGLGRAA